MLTLIAYYWISLLVALLIGLGTAWWVWARREPIAPAYSMWPADERVLPEAVTPAERSADRIVWADSPDNDALNLTSRDIVAPTVNLPPVPVPPVPVPPAPHLPPVEQAPIAPPVPVAPPAPAPAPVPAPPAPVPAAPATPPPPERLAPDDLTIIKGIGPQLNTLLGSLGISRFSQIAAWGAEEVERVDSHLGVFRGRIIRDEWVAQAKLLAAGDIAAFNEQYGEK